MKWSMMSTMTALNGEMNSAIASFRDRSWTISRLTQSRNDLLCTNSHHLYDTLFVLLLCYFIFVIDVIVHQCTVTLN